MAHLIELKKSTDKKNQENLFRARELGERCTKNSITLWSDILGARSRKCTAQSSIVACKDPLSTSFRCMINTENKYRLFSWTCVTWYKSFRSERTPVRALPNDKHVEPPSGAYFLYLPYIWNLHLKRNI